MKKVVLGEVCDFFNGGAWSDKEYVNEGIPVLKVTNCKSTGFQLDNLNYLSEKSREKYKKNNLIIGDVIVATVGSHPNLIESAAGRSCIVNSQVEGFYLNQNAVCIRTKDKRILSQKYLGYLCKCADFQHYIQSRGRGAANQMRIAISSIKEYSFTLPDFENQQYIADILSAYDDLIENNQKQIKLLEEAAQRLYKEWFVDLRFPGHENTKIVDGVPEGWQYEKLGDLVKTTSGGTPSRRKSEYYVNGNIRWIKTKELNDRFIFETEEHITEDAVKNSSAKVLPEGALIVAMYGATIGKIGITAAEMACNQACCAFISFDDMISKEYLYCWLMDNREYLVSQGKGAAQSNLSQEMIRNFSLLCPDKKVIKNFTEIVTTMLENKRVLENKILMLSKARDDLLPKLMSGEVEV